MRWVRFSAPMVMGLMLASAAAAHEMKLEGTEWGIVGDQSDGARFISFAGGGRLFGFGGCNRLSGTYEQHGDHLTISPLTDPKQNRCPTEAMRREEDFMAILAKVRGIQADHTLLLLLDEQGTDLRALTRLGAEPAGD